MSSNFKVPSEFEEREVWIKVVQRCGGLLLPCSGGRSDFVYSEPKKTEEGWEPGDWTPNVEPRCCYSGYHVTQQVSVWCSHSQELIYWAECRGASDTSGIVAEKTAFESIRLLRPVTLAEIRELNYHASTVAPVVLTSVCGTRLVSIAVLLAVQAKIAAAEASGGLIPFDHYDGSELEYINTVREVCTALLNEVLGRTNDDLGHRASRHIVAAREIYGSHDRNHWCDVLLAVATQNWTSGAYSQITTAEILDQIPANIDIHNFQLNEDKTAFVA